MPPHLREGPEEFSLYSSLDSGSDELEILEDVYYSSLDYRLAAIDCL